jgi:hypothetical protein
MVQSRSLGIGIDWLLQGVGYLTYPGGDGYPLWTAEFLALRAGRAGRCGRLSPCGHLRRTSRADLRPLPAPRLLLSRWSASLADPRNPLRCAESGLVPVRLLARAQLTMGSKRNSSALGPGFCSVAFPATCVAVVRPRSAAYAHTS